MLSQTRTPSCVAKEHPVCSESLLAASLVFMNHTMHFIFTLHGQKVNILCIKDIAQIYEVTQSLSCYS